MKEVAALRQRLDSAEAPAEVRDVKALQAQQGRAVVPDLLGRVVHFQRVDLDVLTFLPPPPPERAANRAVHPAVCESALKLPEVSSSNPACPTKMWQQLARMRDALVSIWREVTEVGYGLFKFWDVVAIHLESAVTARLRELRKLDERAAVHPDPADIMQATLDVVLADVMSIRKEEWVKAVAPTNAARTPAAVVSLCMFVVTSG